MARVLDEILVIDIEATCWKGPPPPGEDNEIIEIGIATLDVPSATELVELGLAAGDRVARAGALGPAVHGEVAADPRSPDLSASDAAR